jgi:hypothetical protein
VRVQGDDGVARETLNDSQKRNTCVRSEADHPSEQSDKLHRAKTMQTPIGLASCSKDESGPTTSRSGIIK